MNHENINGLFKFLSFILKNFKDPQQIRALAALPSFVENLYNRNLFPLHLIPLYFYNYANLNQKKIYFSKIKNFFHYRFRSKANNLI